MSVNSIRGARLCYAALLALMTATTVWCQSPSSASVGELFASLPGAAAEAQPAGSGMPVTSGSELSAGVAAATLKLARGGKIRICPQTGLSVNAAGDGLMLGMGAGAVEIEYRAGEGGDILSTPDFNIRLASRASYHFALGVNSRGDTCFKPLSGNSAGVLLSELMGSESFGTPPNEAMIFAGGKIAGRSNLNEECGCPAPAAPPVLRTEATPAPTRGQTDGNDASSASLPRDVTTPVPSSPGENHAVVSAPFVYSAEGDRPETVARLQFSALPNAVFAQEEPTLVVLSEKPVEVSSGEAKKEPGPAPEASQDQKKEKGFMGRMKGFFRSLFHW